MKPEYRRCFLFSIAPSIVKIISQCSAGILFHHNQILMIVQQENQNRKLYPVQLL